MWVPSRCVARQPPTPRSLSLSHTPLFSVLTFFLSKEILTYCVCTCSFSLPAVRTSRALGRAHCIEGKGSTAGLYEIWMATSAFPFHFQPNQCSSYSFCMLVPKTPRSVVEGTTCVFPCSEKDYGRTMKHTFTLFSPVTATCPSPLVSLTFHLCSLLHHTQTGFMGPGSSEGSRTVFVF